MTDVIKFRFESATVELAVFDGKSKGIACLSCLYAKKRRRGHARAVVKMALKYADRENLRVVLDAEPYGSHKKDEFKWLVPFYKEFGFKVTKWGPTWAFMSRKKQK